MSTRQTPRRAAQLIGGSLFWVIKGLILCRQTVLAIDAVGEGGARRCRVRLDRQIKPTQPAPRRAFQGWRYLPAEDAPPDLDFDLRAADLPEALVSQLRRLGAW